MSDGTRNHLNAVVLPLLNAVFCLDCEVISSSRGDQCAACKSRSLVSLARMLGLMPASERIITGWSAGPKRFLSGEPEGSSWAFTSLVCSTRLDARLAAVFDERSRV